MRRREFILLFGGAATAWPLVVLGQQPERVRRIGFLGTSSPSGWNHYVSAFAQRVHELGWIEGSTAVIEYRWAEGRSERFAEIAAEFVRLKVDVIVTSGAAGIAVKRVTSTIPIVFAVANDPVGDGLVASLARPGGNVTGLSEQARDLASKRLGLLREVFPGVRRLAILADVGYPAAVREMRDVQTTAHMVGLDVVTLEIRRSEDIAPAFETLTKRADALYICAGPLSSSNQLRIGTLAVAARLPSISSLKENVEAGGLMSYGPNLSDLFRRAAEYVDKILRGAKPGELPIEQPTKYELAINLKTAKAIGLAVPESFLLRVDEVIE